jgi:hypothetical protein
MQCFNPNGGDLIAVTIESYLLELVCFEYTFSVSLKADDERWDGDTPLGSNIFQICVMWTYPPGQD